MSRILIVDDEFLIRYTLEEGLRDRGHETQSAENVEEGLLKARKFHPDVVLLDNLLEHSVGMDEIATFKAADPQIQVILMTAYGSVSQAGGLRLYFKALRYRRYRDGCQAQCGEDQESGVSGISKRREPGISGGQPGSAAD